MATGFATFATETASTKRSTVDASGKKATGTTNLSSLSVLPLMPVTPESVRKYGIEKPMITWETFVDGDKDIKKKDVLVVDGTDYNVRVAAKWPYDDGTYMHLIVEETESV